MNILYFFVTFFIFFFSSLILLIISIFLFQYLKYCSADYNCTQCLLTSFTRVEFSPILVPIMISGSYIDRSTRVNSVRSSVLTLHFYRNTFNGWIGCLFQLNKIQSQALRKSVILSFFCFFSCFFFKENHVNPTVSKMYIVYTLFF